MIRGNESPEWLADLELRGAYRIASHWGSWQERPQWFYVYDCREIDANEIKRFARREDAEAYADKLNGKMG